MHRRTFLQCAIGTALASPLIAAVKQDKLDAASEILNKSAAEGQVHAAAPYVRQGSYEYAKSFGAAASPDTMFLIASITKTMSVAALMISTTEVSCGSRRGQEIHSRVHRSAARQDYDSATAHAHFRLA